jgi:hypothetical protein
MSNVQIEFDGKFFAWADGVPGVEVGSLPNPQPIEFAEPIMATMHFDLLPAETEVQKAFLEWLEAQR